MKELQWSTISVKVSDLKLLDINPRKISDESKAKLVESLKKWNLVEIPAINTNMEIIGGNQRVVALKMLGRDDEEIDVRCPNRELTKKEMKEYAILSNTHAGEFDFEILELEFKEIDLDGIGFDINGLDEWRKKIKIDVQDDDFEVPKGGLDTDIVLGDLFEIGEHRLLCGDSTDSDQMEKLMGGQLADMIHTDPPYNVDYGANKKHPSWKIRSIENDNMSTDNWEKFCKDIYANFILFNKGDVYMWGASGPEGMRMRLWLIESGCHWSATIIWKKNQLVLSPAKYQRLYEPCFYGWNGKSTYRADRKQVEVWDIDRPRISKEHPTMKPIELCARPISNSSRERDIVLDMFLGSGSTMIAAHQLNRKCYGMELDPRYCQVIINRMKNIDSEIVIKKNGYGI